MSRQVLILTKEELVAFYRSYGLFPDDDRGQSVPLLRDIVYDAKEKNEVFGFFVLESIYETDNKLKLRPGLDSWEKLFDYYCFFIVGYSGIKLSQAGVKGQH